MDLLVVSVASDGAQSHLGDRIRRAGASSSDSLIGATWPEVAEQAVARLDGRRLVIDADLTGLNIAVQRLMRAGVLKEVETAVLLQEPVRYLHRLGLPSDLTGQIEVAVRGPARVVGVIKDDSGGVCIDSAAMSRWSDTDTWWLRAMVDDQQLCDGTARSLSLRRLSPSELEATVRIGRLKRRTRRGRSLQLACDEARIITDGQPRERPRSKRTFWSEPTLWKLALPAAE